MMPSIDQIDQKLSEKDVKVELLKPIDLSDSDQEHDVGDPDLKFSKSGNQGQKRRHFEGFSVSFRMYKFFIEDNQATLSSSL